MDTKPFIKSLTISGFKSIRELKELELNPLNILIGSNGAGKSNFVSFFRMLGEMVAGRLQMWTAEQGGAERVVFRGMKETSCVKGVLDFQTEEEEPWHEECEECEHPCEMKLSNLGPIIDVYLFTLKAINADNSFIISSERGGFYFEDVSWQEHGLFDENPLEQPSCGIYRESFLQAEAAKGNDRAKYFYDSISSWKVYHFHDTTSTAGMKKFASVHDNAYLRPDASNLAAFLYRIQNESPEVYEQIRKTVRLAIPFFDDFVLRPETLKTEERRVNLCWRQLGSDYPYWPSQLSDGSLRFICLVTALMQPDPPSTIVIDEPELGLHPYAITLLASLIKSASKRMQVIVSTQSVPLVNEFSINDLIVVERENDESVFHRYDEADFQNWLEEYTVGELWQKNILGGRPPK